MIPDTPMQALEYMDVIVLVPLSIVLGGLLLMHRREYGSLEASISQTVASSRRSGLMFMLIMLVAYPLYYMWLWFWVGPLLAMPISYYVLLLVSAIAEMVFVLIPASTGWRLHTHQIAAGVVGVAMAILPAMMLTLREGLSGASRVSVSIFYAALAAMAVLFCMPRYRRHNFLYEVAYCTMFLGVISLVAHTAS